MNSELQTTWALEQCEEWLRLHEKIPLGDGTLTRSGNLRMAFRGSKEERERISNRVRYIAEATFGGSRFHVGTDGVHRLIFELEEGVEIREKLGYYSLAPSLPADTLHPWVWEPARPHWDGGNFDAAIWAAAIRVNNALKAKLNRPDLGETKLVQEAFGISAAAPGKARLRLCDHSNPDLFRDRHLGALNLGTGLFSGIRNPLNHVGADDLTEQEALEMLATWSLFARWIERAELEWGSEE